MEYKLTFNNGRSTVIECENTGTPLQDKINKAEKQFGSEVVKVNDKPIQKHELGGFLVGALIGAGIGVVATRTRKTATKSTAKKKTTTGTTKTPAGNTSKKYLPKRRIKSVNTTFGKRLYQDDINDGMYIKSAVKFATGGAVRKSGNEAKYQRQVDEVNRLISLAYDSIGDPIPVVDINSTWEQPYVYLPVKYTNGTLRISYYEVGGMDHGKVKKYIVKKSEMYFDNPLPMIARMYRKAIKQNKKQEEND